MKKIIFIFIAIVISQSVLAVDESPTGRITGYYTGWSSDTVRVTIEGATYIESNCAVKDGYMTSESDNSGYRTHASALLAAFMSGKPVSVIVDGCIVQRPRIVGVYID